jgi:hypothetical protein
MGLEAPRTEVILTANEAQIGLGNSFGGGDSRVLKYFSNEYECWSADKCEGLAMDPSDFLPPHYRIVYDYVGSFNRELPDQYSDFVFSVSALKHTPEDQMFALTC